MDYVRRFEQAYDVNLVARMYDSGRNYKLADIGNFAQDLGIDVREVMDAIYDIEAVYNIVLEVDSYKDVVVNPYGY
jgi:hypothetical protein